MSETKDAPRAMRSPLPTPRLMYVGSAHRAAKPTRRAVLKGAAAAAVATTVAFISGAAGAANDAAMPKPFIPPPTPGTFPGCILIRDRYGRHLWQLAAGDDTDGDGATRPDGPPCG